MRDTSQSVIFELPWPHKNLSSNARVHWSKRRDATKHARWAARHSTPKGTWDSPTLEFTYYPPDGRRRDAQNMPAMLKAYIDGIADALKRDDSTFKCVFPSEFSSVIPGGSIVVKITAAVGVG